MWKWLVTLALYGALTDATYGSYDVYDSSGFNSYRSQPNSSQFLFRDGGCDNYDPSQVDWDSVKNDIMDFLSSGAAGLGPDQISAERMAPVLVRAAFHDAGAYNGDYGGADGSCVLAADEQDWSSNSFPFSFMPYVRSTLQTVVDNYQISWADAIAVGGVAGAQYLGAPRGWSLRVGRCDNDQANPDVLPSGNLRYGGFTRYWRMVGISIRDAAALMGIHSAIDNDSGGAPVTWSNEMYIAQASGGITVTDEAAQDGPDGVEWIGGVWKYTVNDANIAPDNLQETCGAEGRGCPHASQFVTSVYAFANSQRLWATAFKDAYSRMTEIGAQFSPYESTAYL